MFSFCSRIFDFRILLYVFKLVLILPHEAVFMGDFLYSFSLPLKEIDLMIPCAIHFVLSISYGGVF